MSSDILLVLALLFSGASAATDIVYCRTSGFSSPFTESKESNFQPENIDPTLCTHISYISVIVAYDGTLTENVPPTAPGDISDLEKIKGLKTISPTLKLIITTGGWDDMSLIISRVMQVPATRSAFVQNVVNYVLSKGFDGFDLDWEYPNDRGGIPADKENYVTVLNELRAAFDAKGLTLFNTVNAEPVYINKSYNVPEIVAAAHYTIITAHFYTWVFDGITTFNNNMNNSPFYLTDEAKSLNVKSSITSWISNGADPAKLILDVGFDANSFTLEDANCHAAGCCSSGPGIAGPITEYHGYLAYNEICVKKMNEPSWTTVYSTLEEEEYMYKNLDWVVYETPRSAEVKAKYAVEKGLAGVASFGIEFDDFNGTCGSTFPILKAMRSALYQIP